MEWDALHLAETHGSGLVRRCFRAVNSSFDLLAETKTVPISALLLVLSVVACAPRPESVRYCGPDSLDNDDSMHLNPCTNKRALFVITLNNGE